jgi:hypothetical protein
MLYPGVKGRQVNSALWTLRSSSLSQECFLAPLLPAYGGGPLCPGWLRGGRSFARALRWTGCLDSRLPSDLPGPL